MMFSFLLLLFSSCVTVNSFIFGKEIDLRNMRFRWSNNVGFSCISWHNNDKDFKTIYIGSTNQQFDKSFIGHLNNGKKISIFIVGLGYTLSKSDALIAKEWSRVSDRNICYVSYPIPTFDAITSAILMVKNHILEFIAKVTGDLVLHIFRDMSHVEMSGFSFGAHIASRSCRYLFNVTGTKVEFLQGIDPAGISFTLSKKYFLQKGDAKYVQSIHTSKLMGTWYNIADADIRVKLKFPGGLFNTGSSVEKHCFAANIFFVICTRRFTLIAEERGKGHVYLDGLANGHHIPAPNATQIVVGPYGAMRELKRGKFDLNLIGFENQIYGSLGAIAKSSAVSNFMWKFKQGISEKVANTKHFFKG